MGRVERACHQKPAAKQHLNTEISNNADFNSNLIYYPKHFSLIYAYLHRGENYNYDAVVFPEFNLIVFVLVWKKLFCFVQAQKK